MRIVKGTAATNAAIAKAEAALSIAVQHIEHLEPTAEPVTEPRLGRSVSIDQAARLLSVLRRTIYNRIREGRLRTVRTLGGSQRVLVESLSSLGFRPQAFSTSASAATFDLRPVRS